MFKLIKKILFNDELSETVKLFYLVSSLSSIFSLVFVLVGLLFRVPFSLTVICIIYYVICTLVFTIYAASKYNVAISVGWLAVAGALAVVMSVAAPPVPGASLLTYIALFNELGIPSVSLISAMIFDIMFGIFAVAGNQVLLQMDLILQADRIGLLNRDLLRKP